MENAANVLGKKQIISIVGIFFLIIGLIVSIYLVGKQQQLKSKASAGSFVNAFEIKDKDGNVLTCDGSTNPPTCTTKSLDIKVRVIDPTLLLP